MKNQIFLRKCEKNDCDLLFQWINEPSVRNNAFNTKCIPYEEHVEWFNKSLTLQNRVMYICIDDHKPVGQIRIDIENGIGIISYMVEKSFRGQGIGKAMLKLLQVEALNYPNIKALKGFVKKENIPSRKAFISNGYSEEIELEYMIYTLDLER